MTEVRDTRWARTDFPPWLCGGRVLSEKPQPRRRQRGPGCTVGCADEEGVGGVDGATGDWRGMSLEGN
jgi:hypothetical protein